MRFSRLFLLVTAIAGLLILGCTSSQEKGDGFSGMEGVHSQDGNGDGNVNASDANHPDDWHPDAGNQDTGKLTLALKQADNCQVVAKRWKQLLIQAMTERMVDAWQEAVNWRGPCGYDDVTAYGDITAAPYDVTSTSDSGGGTADSYSGTNNQIPGVDEADIMKNDGKWIYMLANGKLHIINAWPPNQAHRVSVTPISGYPVSMLIYKDRLTVFSVDSDYKPECDYNYNCYDMGRGIGTHITTYDISDRIHPVEVRHSYMPAAHYVKARRIGPQVYTVVYFPFTNMEELLYKLKYTPDEILQAEDAAGCDEPIAMDKKEIRQAFDKLYQKNLAAINDMSIKDTLLPTLKDTVYSGNGSKRLSSPFTDCHSYFLANGHGDIGLIAVTGFDITKQQPFQAAVVRSRPGPVFATHQSIYLSMWYSKSMEQTWFTGVSNGTITVIHRFDLTPGSPRIRYRATGWVPGHSLNQFSMDEQDDYVRIATTVGHPPNPDAHNLITVLKPNGRDLDVVGQLDKIAPGEDIRAVRFNGNLGFVVTFKKTDPLFVIDLSDPKSPKIKGKLEIPGFSTYMHFMDRTHLLSIGYDGLDEGPYAWFQGVKLQVFDVTDITKPKLLHKEVIGTRGSASEATLHHLAFNYFKPKDLLAIPMIICEGGSGGNYGTYMTFNGLMVYNVTIENGFKYLGGIPHDKGGKDNPISCGQWWADSSSTVKRSVILDDHVASVAQDRIDFAPLSDLSNIEASVSLK